MKRTRKVMKTTLAAAGLLVAGAGCGAEEWEPLSDVEVEGIPELSQPLTAFNGTCTYDTSTKAVTIEYGTVATIILSKRSADSALLLNGDDLKCTAGGTATTVKTSAVKSVSIANTAGTANPTLILDYLNGTFGLGTSTGAGTTVSGVAGAGSEFKVRGTERADKIFLSDQTGNVLGVSLTGRFVDITVAGLAAGAGTGGSRTVTPAITVSAANGNDIVRFGPTGSGGTTKLEDTITRFNDAWVATVYGGAGNDTFEMGNTKKGSVELNGGEGTDSVKYSERTGPVYVQLSGTRLSGDFSDTTATDREFDLLNTDLETVVGGSGADVFDVAARAFDANNAAQTFNGGPGDDFFVDSAVSHKTIFIGGDGTDTVTYAGRASAVTVTMGTGANDGDQTAGAIEDDDVQSTIEQLVGSQGNDTLTGSSKADVICGHGGTDTIDGGAGDDTFAVVLTAPVGTTFKQTWANPKSSNKSSLCNDAAADTYTGGSGVDLIDYSLRGETLADPTTDASTDGAVGSATITVVMDGTAAGTNEDQVNSDVENAYGTTGVDSITGNASNNVLWGGGGNDALLSGGDGNDTLEATGTTVLCNCGAGDDILIGSCTGTDSLCEL